MAARVWKITLCRSVRFCREAEINITFVKLKGIVIELRNLTSAVNRLADLKELELQSVHRITTRVTSATKADLADTRVGYTDPAYSEMVSLFEKRVGRSLTDEEASKIEIALSEMEDQEA